MKKFLKENLIYIWLGAFAGNLFDGGIVNLGFWIFILGCIGLIEWKKSK